MWLEVIVGRPRERKGGSHLKTVPKVDVEDLAT